MIYYQVYLGDDENWVKFLSKEKAIEYVLNKCPDEATVEKELTEKSKVRFHLKRIKDADDWYEEAWGDINVKVKYEVINAESIEVIKHIQQEVKEEGKVYIPRRERVEERIMEKHLNQKFYVEKNDLSRPFFIHDGELIIELQKVYLEWPGNRYEELQTIERTVWIERQEIKFMDEESMEV